MKTDELRKALEDYPNGDIILLWVDKLEADNAAMREALKPFADHLGSIKGTFTEDTGFRFDDKVYCRLTRPLYKSDFMRAERALTPDSGKEEHNEAC